LSATEEKGLGLDSIDSVPYIRAKLAEKTNGFAWNLTGFLEIYVPVAAFYTYYWLPTVKFIRNFNNKGKKKALHSQLERPKMQMHLDF
jgi:hypothetical protein